MKTDSYAAGGPPTGPDSKAHAIVIGSGFGGLAAAIRLGARGYRVTVLEKLDAPGGRATVFQQDGFTFDAGPTIVTAPHLFEELWALCGRRFDEEIDLRPMSPFYRISFDGGDHFDYFGDLDRTIEEIRRYNPADVEGYKRYLEISREACRIGFSELGDVPFDSWRDMARAVPDIIRLRGHRSVFSLISKHIQDPRLRTVLSFHPLLIGGNPFSVSAVYSLVSHLERHWGVHSAIGGTGRLVDGMVDLIEGQGNELRYDAEVAEILVERGRATGVRLADGTRLQADIVVSNADSAWTYRYLLPASVRRHWTDRRIERSRYSNGLFVWYFGTRRRYDDLAHHTIMLGPRYKGLLDDIFTHKRLAEDFSLYLHRPTATDPGLAPPGCDTFYALSPVPHLEADVDWSVAAEPYRQAIAKRLGETLLPGVEDQVVTSRVMTPVDFRDRLCSFNGAGFSLEPVLWQSAWFRPHNRSEDVDQLYFVGAGTHPGAGLPGVLSSARILDKVVPEAHAIH
ncbi:MAG: phytoene desaturase [Chromatiaceae bacterium]|jgi:phytoene desaturase